MEIKNTTKVLIIEDEIIVALDIKSAIEKLDFEVTDTVTNYDEAFTSVEQNQPDIILMDINLENSKDGITIAQDLQKQHYKVPIIYLTAFSDDDTIKRAVATNPVGYLIKPFKRDELKSTILLAQYKIDNRSDQLINQFVKIGKDYFYDEQTMNLYYKDKEISLTQKERQLLDILYKSKGQIVPFETIEFNIWKEDTVSNSTLRTLIYRLRSKLEYKLIDTIPQRGCRLN